MSLSKTKLKKIIAKNLDSLVQASPADITAFVDFILSESSELPTRARTIAEHLGIPLRTLNQLLISGVRAGLIEIGTMPSVRGRLLPRKWKLGLLEPKDFQLKSFLGERIEPRNVSVVLGYKRSSRLLGMG